MNWNWPACTNILIRVTISGITNYRHRERISILNLEHHTLQLTCEQNILDTVTLLMDFPLTGLPAYQEFHKV